MTPDERLPLRCLWIGVNRSERLSELKVLALHPAEFLLIHCERVREECSSKREEVRPRRAAGSSDGQNIAASKRSTVPPLTTENITCVGSIFFNVVVQRIGFVPPLVAVVGSAGGPNWMCALCLSCSASVNSSSLCGWQCRP